jgi:hypothetical protein
MCDKHLRGTCFKSQLPALIWMTASFTCLLSHYYACIIWCSWFIHILNSLKHSVYVTPTLTLRNFAFCPHSVFVYFLWFSEQTEIVFINSNYQFVFVPYISYEAGAEFLSTVVS